MHYQLEESPFADPHVDTSMCAFTAVKAFVVS